MHKLLFYQLKKKKTLKTKHASKKTKHLKRMSNDQIG